MPLIKFIDEDMKRFGSSLMERFEDLRQQHPELDIQKIEIGYDYEQDTKSYTATFEYNKEVNGEQQELSAYSYTDAYFAAYEVEYYVEGASENARERLQVLLQERQTNTDYLSALDEKIADLKKSL